MNAADPYTELRPVYPDDLPPDDAPGPFPTSWAPVDVAPVLAGLLAGTVARPVPTIAAVREGLALLYAGKVNGIAGESGCGKTWTALAASAQELAAGSAVVYIDYEDDAVGILGRLLDLGTDPAALQARFVYVHPDERFDVVAAEQLDRTLDEYRPTLVVIDSTGEGLSLEGLDPNADEKVSGWFRRLPRRIAATGAAVLVLDHVTKTDDSGLWPIGSQRKRAAISGVQYMQRTVRPFAKGQAGVAILICAKDRHGAYRSGERVAELAVSPCGAGVTVELVAATQNTQTGAGTFRPTALMEKVSRTVETSGPLSARGIKELVTGKREYVTSALALLIAEGFVTTSLGSKGATMHTTIKPFRVDLDTGEHSPSEPTPERAPSVPRLRDGGRGTHDERSPGNTRGTLGNADGGTAS